MIDSKKTMILIFLFFSTSFAQNSKLNIAVMDLDPTGISKNEAQFLTDRLRTELFETGVYQVVERDKMNAILNEQGFQQTGCTSVECAIEIGQLLNVQVMVAGSIGKIEEIYSLSLRMIDVETGAIIRTATRDYEGKLSDVLTEVIPELSAELAESQNYKPVKDEEDRNPEKVLNRFAILLKGGFSYLTYTNDINKAIQDLNASISPDINELPDHSVFGFEVRYVLSTRWNLKIGLDTENLTSGWTNSFGTTLLFQKWDFNREYQFVTTYIGANYSLWRQPQSYDIYLGLAMGSTVLKSSIKQDFLRLDGSTSHLENSSSYSAFSGALSLGGIYYLSSRLSLGLELDFKGGGKFNTSDQIPDLVKNEDVIGIFYPKEIISSGILLALYFGYHL